VHLFVEVGERGAVVAAIEEALAGWLAYRDGVAEACVVAAE